MSAALDIFSRWGYELIRYPSLWTRLPIFQRLFSALFPPLSRSPAYASALPLPLNPPERNFAGRNCCKPGELPSVDAG